MEWFWLSLAADFIGVAGAFFALRAWQQSRQLKEAQKLEEERQNKKVKVSLKSTTRNIDIPFELRRSEFSRAEVLGRIGMIPMKVKGKRFEIEYLNTREFLQRVNEISDGQSDMELVINCTQAELDQFDMTHFDHLFRPI